MGILKQMSSRTWSVGVGVLAAASLSVGAASAAPTNTEPAAATQGNTNSSSAATITPAARSAGQARSGSGVSDAAALEAYWTPARMKAATPAESSPELAAQADRWAKAQQADQRKGIRPVTNNGPTRTVAGAPSTVLTSPSAKATTSALDPNLPVSAPTAYTAGKVFFTKTNGLNYVCSGTIINSEGKDSVWTAGHCVHGGKGGDWHQNWAFVPAYDDDLTDHRPYGTWTASFFSSRTAWVKKSDFSQDMGVATMNTRSGHHIVDYFGGQGITVNRGKRTSLYAFGYPAEAPFDGGNLMRCQGQTRPEWNALLFWSQTVKIPCTMTRGSSGGGWLNLYDGNWGHLNGVNSRIDQKVGPTIMLSPYFDDDAWSLYNATRNN